MATQSPHKAPSEIVIWVVSAIIVFALILLSIYAPGAGQGGFGD